MDPGSHSRCSLARDDMERVFACGPLVLAMTARVETCARILAAHRVRVMRDLVSLKTKRAQGMPDARCTRGRVCSKKSTRVSNHRYTASTGIPCTMVLTVSFVISPVTGLFCHRHSQDAEASMRT